MAQFSCNDTCQNELDSKDSRVLLVKPNSMGIFSNAALVTPTQICYILFQEHILGRIDVIHVVEYLTLPCTFWPKMKYNHTETFWLCNLACYLTDFNRYRCLTEIKKYNSNRTKDTQSIIAVDIEINSFDSSYIIPWIIRLSILCLHQ